MVKEYAKKFILISALSFIMACNMASKSEDNAGGEEAKEGAPAQQYEMNYRDIEIRIPDGIDQHISPGGSIKLQVFGIFPDGNSVPVHADWSSTDGTFDNEFASEVVFTMKEDAPADQTHAIVNAKIGDKYTNSMFILIGKPESKQE